MDNASFANATDMTKQLVFSLSGMTTGVKLTLSSAQSASYTLTIPNITANDTLPTLALANTFTANQTIKGNMILTYSSDATKQLTFSVNTASASSTNLVISSNQQTTGTNTIYL